MAEHAQRFASKRVPGSFVAVHAGSRFAMALSRRSLLQLSGTAAGAMALSRFAQGPATAAQPESQALLGELQVCDPPGDPLEALLERNRGFSRAWQAMSRESDPVKRLKLKTEIFYGGCQINPQALDEGQRPWAALLSCADARVAPEFVFASGSGELFQVRCAGNTAFDDAVASMEYAVSVLKVPLIVVLGHSNCGAVKAAMGSDPLTPLLEGLVKPIRASLVSGDSLSQAVQGNARYAAGLLPARSAVLKEAQASGALTIRSAYFDLATGLVTVN
jgi:carbonic anhydrase